MIEIRVHEEAINQKYLEFRLLLHLCVHTCIYTYIIIHGKMVTGKGHCRCIVMPTSMNEIMNEPLWTWPDLWYSLKIKCFSARQDQQNLHSYWYFIKLLTTETASRSTNWFFEVFKSWYGDSDLIFVFQWLVLRKVMGIAGHLKHNQLID